MTEQLVIKGENGQLVTTSLLIAEKFIMIGERQAVIYVNGVLQDDAAVIGHLIGTHIFVENNNA